MADVRAAGTLLIVMSLVHCVGDTLISGTPGVSVGNPMLLATFYVSTASIAEHLIDKVTVYLSTSATRTMAC